MWEISVHNTLVSVVLNECHLPFVFNSSHIPKKCITTAAISIASSGSYVEDACDFPQSISYLGFTAAKKEESFTRLVLRFE